MTGAFDERFALLTGHPPFPWQRELYRRFMRDEAPTRCEVPTGLGKTSVIAVWLLARNDGAPVPRRLVYVVNRRTVVDQTTAEVERLRTKLAEAGIQEDLAVSTLRGQMADNREWSADPSRPAVICGTVDMIGSRLLFGGYRLGFKTRPLHAGFLGQDALLVHDEAHLEPAFQELVERIAREQRGNSGDPWPLRVLALTATARGTAHEDPRKVLPIDDEDRADPEVAKRVGATKRLSLHLVDDGKIVDPIVAKVRSYEGTGAAVLVFLRTVDDVTSAVTKLAKAGLPTQQLTGTMRGYERDRLVTTDPIFRRFLPGTAKADLAEGTVVLVSTSAGEVGVNLSPDHLVCDLSTFDAMAQRFGRTNRFGRRDDTEIHVFHPPEESLLPKKKGKGDEEEELETEDTLDGRRLRTLALLARLNGDASPDALSRLDAAEREAAFAPPPRIPECTEILFDAWAMTSVRERMPGRPPVAPYLHGLEAWEPPTMQVAWREEVDRLHPPSADRAAELRERYPPSELLEDFPLKPHELLRDQSRRIVETLAAAIAAHPDQASAPAWRVSEEGAVELVSLDSLVGGDLKRAASELASSTLVLGALRSRPIGGLLQVAGFGPREGEGASADVSEQWGDPARRERRFDGEAPAGMRLIRALTLRSAEEASDDDEATDLVWRWYERPKGADDEGSRSAKKPVRLDVHSGDVERRAREIVERLPLTPGVKRAVVIAARQHDHGKNRRVWQRSIGNPDRSLLLAKSGGKMRPLELTLYRHELGSMLDAERDPSLLDGLEPAERELALHLIAAHHGRARPHFPAEELFDPEAVGVDAAQAGVRVMQRFAKLQRQYGRWGLAYLESLVRAADYAASADPSQEIDT